jgi:hypothetical protein
MNLKPSKALGQNFLTDKSVLFKIIKSAELEKGDIVLEIGPGTGILTRELLKKEGHLHRADEIGDEALVELIQIDSFYDLSTGPHLKNTAELASFKIEIEDLGEKRFAWIFGKPLAACTFTRGVLSDRRRHCHTRGYR